MGDLRVIFLMSRCIDCGKRIMDESNRMCAVCETKHADLMEQVDIEEEMEW